MSCMSPTMFTLSAVDNVHTSPTKDTVSGVDNVHMSPTMYKGRG